MAQLYTLNGQQVYNSTDAAGNTQVINAKTGQVVSTTGAAPGVIANTTNTSYGAVNTNPTSNTVSPIQMTTAPAAPVAQQTPTQNAPASIAPATANTPTPSFNASAVDTSQSSTTNAQNTAGTAATTQPALPGSAGSPVQAPAPDAATVAQTGGSVVDLLNSLGQDSSYTGRAALAQQLGIANYTGTATQNQALAQKYQTYFNSVSGSQAPTSNPSAQISQATAPAVSSDPVFNSMASMMSPIMASLTQVLQDINNPAITGVNLQQEYNTLAQQNNLPALQTQMLNMQNIMNGTEQDIRDEVSKAGGFATESQVQAMTAARNNVILKQYNALSTQYQAANTNVQNMMQYAASDQQTALAREQATAGVVENMASISAQIQSMSMTMQQNAVANYQKNLATVGGDYNAFASTIPANMQPYVESIMGLAPGTLSDPQELQILTNASYKQIQLQIAAQRAAVYGYNAGYPVNISTPTSPTQPTYQGGTPAANVSPFSQNNPINNTNSQTQYTIQPGDGLRAIASKFGITSDAGIKAIASLNGIQDINKIKSGQTIQIPIAVKNNATGQTGYVSAANYDASKYTPLGSTPVIGTQTAIDKAYQSMVTQVKTAQATPITGSPLNKGRLTRNANSALKNYLASPVYQAVSSGATYLARINAAMADPGSISDTSLADSIIKIETGGGQVTEAQLNTYFAGQSYSDAFAVVGDKIVAKGGVLSPSQRADLAGLAKGVFDNYQQQYENLYVQAMQNLQGQGIPLNYGGNLPDFLSLIQTAPAQ